MGVLYDVLFKPIGRGDGSTAAKTTTTTTTTTVTAAAAAVAVTCIAAADDPPEWVLDRRDGGSRLVWRRGAASCRRRVEFLDAVQVRVFERDDYSWSDDLDDDRDDDDDDDGQACWTDDWCGRDEFTDGTKSLQSDDCPVLVAVSVTALGLCIGLASMFAPVRWLLQQLIVDD